MFSSPQGATMAEREQEGAQRWSGRGLDRVPCKRQPPPHLLSQSSCLLHEGPGYLGISGTHTCLQHSVL